MCRPVRTPSYYKEEENNYMYQVYHTYARCQVGNMSDNRVRYLDKAIIERKKAIEKEGVRRDGAKRYSSMKTGELATKSTAQVEKMTRRSAARVVRQVWVQSAAHSKESGA